MNKILSEEALLHYQTIDEEFRLLRPSGALEFIRSIDIIQRFIAKPPATILDIGGGCGIYSCYFAKQGYELTLIDAVESHIEKAKRASQQLNFPIKEIKVGDARDLQFNDSSFDTVLMLGPLYHLINKEDRITALKEAKRVLKPGGYLFAAIISRYASMLDGFFENLVDDPIFCEIVNQDLIDGQHRNPTNNPWYFTTTYFHKPSELKIEMEQAGLLHEKTIAIEAMGWLLSNLEALLSNEAKKEFLLNTIRKVEIDESLIGMSAHIMGVGRK